MPPESAKPTRHPINTYQFMITSIDRQILFISPVRYLTPTDALLASSDFCRIMGVMDLSFRHGYYTVNVI